jgi:NTP pyrophosphatase (non-canonical NTP hydrolase)
MDREEVKELDTILFEVKKEIGKAIEKYVPMFSPHEGMSILNEEVDELWDEVKKKQPQNKEAMRKEAIQVAAMAVRFIYDICSENRDYGRKL